MIAGFAQHANIKSNELQNYSVWWVNLVTLSQIIYQRPHLVFKLGYRKWWKKDAMKFNKILGLFPSCIMSVKKKHPHSLHTYYEQNVYHFSVTFNKTIKTQKIYGFLNHLRTTIFTCVQIDH